MLRHCVLVAAAAALVFAPAVRAADCGLEEWASLHADGVSSKVSFDDNSASIRFGVRHEDCIFAEDLSVDLYTAAGTCVASEFCVSNPGAAQCGGCAQHTERFSCLDDVDFLGNAACAWSEVCDTSVALTDQYLNLFDITQNTTADCAFPNQCAVQEESSKMDFVIAMDTTQLQNADDIYIADFTTDENSGNPLDRLKLCVRATAWSAGTGSQAVIFDETVVEVFIDAITGFSSAFVEAERRGASTESDTIVAVGTTEAFQCAQDPNSGLYAPISEPVAQNGIMRVCIAGASDSVQCEQVWSTSIDQAGGVGERSTVIDGVSQFLTQTETLVVMDVGDGLAPRLGCLVETLLQADYFEGGAPDGISVEGEVALGFFGADVNGPARRRLLQAAEENLSTFTVTVSLFTSAQSPIDVTADDQNAAAAAAAAERLELANVAAAAARVAQEVAADAVAVAERRYAALQVQEAALAALQQTMQADADALAVVSQRGSAEVADGTTAGGFAADYGTPMCEAVGSLPLRGASCFFHVIAAEAAGDRGRRLRRLATIVTFELGVVVDEAQAAAARTTLAQTDEVAVAIEVEVQKDAALAPVRPQLEPPADVAVSAAISSVTAAEQSVSAERVAVAQELEVAELELVAATTAVAAAAREEEDARAAVAEANGADSRVATEGDANSDDEASLPLWAIASAVGGGMLLVGIAATVQGALSGRKDSRPDLTDTVPLSPRTTGRKQMNPTFKSPAQP